MGGMGMQPMGGMGMQPMGGMGMQPMMPIGGFAPVINGPVRDKEYNEMRRMAENPYPGSFGISCDLCDTKITVKGGFYHSDYLESDYCLTCASTNQG